jgi:dephospho-CoA kinase
MLRVGLTGGLGSGKSTIADIFHTLGAHVIKADLIGRDLMRPGHTVYDDIVARFGPQVLQPTGELDRAALARIVFEGDGAKDRLDALNAIVHPAVIAVQMQWMAGLDQTAPHGVAIVESALIFETKFAEIERRSDGPVVSRGLDRILLVTAPDELKVERFVLRTLAGRAVSAAEHAALAADARHRLDFQIPETEKSARCDFIIDNSGSLAETTHQVRRIYALLAAEAQAT